MGRPFPLGSGGKHQAAKREQQHGRHYERAEFEESPRAHLMPVAAQRGQPQDGRERAGD